MMDKYIQQLVEDLELAAHNPPKPSYIETPEGFEDFQSIVNLGLTPFKTIEQLTGIKQEAFPDLTYLEGRHWRALLDAIFAVFDSLIHFLYLSFNPMPDKIIGLTFSKRLTFVASCFASAI